jgi:hypothetical protein
MRNIIKNWDPSLRHILHAHALYYNPLLIKKIKNTI